MAITRIPAGRMLGDFRQGFGIEQLNDGGEEPFGLAQGQVVDRPQRQGRRDGEVRVGALPAGGRSGFRPPALNRFVTEPNRQAAPLAQGGVVRRPVAHPEALLGDMMAPRRVALKGIGQTKSHRMRGCLPYDTRRPPAIAASLQQRRHLQLF